MPGMNVKSLKFGHSRFQWTSQGATDLFAALVANIHSRGTRRQYTLTVCLPAEPKLAKLKAEPSDDVFPIIPPEELPESVQNLAILEEKKIIKQGVKQKLVKSQDASTHSIPLYLYEESGTSKCTKVDRKFVEVIHNNEKLFIRKTLVWLFQENERISSDHLFRVRAHQPFNSSGKIIMSQCDNSKLPTVKDSVCLGDICTIILLC
ncbi:uncharacterized protein [Dysidea avara]|uniref:uncharacterized protein isoform X2 n=1 Tax=Dysidea avara TaxID=196820 RepID=UPI003316CB2E